MFDPSRNLLLPCADAINLQNGQKEVDMSV